MHGINTDTFRIAHLEVAILFISHPNQMCNYAIQSRYFSSRHYPRNMRGPPSLFVKATNDDNFILRLYRYV